MNSCEFTWAFRPAHSAHGNFRGHLHLNGSRVAKVSFDAYSTCSRAPLSVARGNFRGHSVSDRPARGKSSNLDGREAPCMHIYGTISFLGLVSNPRFGNKTLLNGFPSD